MCREIAFFVLTTLWPGNGLFTAEIFFTPEIFFFYSRKFGPCRSFQLDLDRRNLFFNTWTASINKNQTGDSCYFYIRAFDSE